DSVRVLLYEAQHPYTLLGSVQCVVQRNGYVNANLSLSAAGPYYVSIQHRNHIFSWSAVPLSPDPFTETLTYNFSSSANQVYGSNAFQIESGVWAFYAGDINQDENIDLSDYSLYESDALNFASGYIATDLNGDGSVDLLDSPVLDDNMNAFIFSIHP
ncbi:MAG TPA: hypothetical protein PLP34_06375, partial [Chitinophagaceae bacterium]|nr:hypothetical protein [Chitinophagaceae bacterium]